MHHRASARFLHWNMETPMPESITIAGQSFNVPLRYEEGHELNANEASALNQTFHENIRNNLAKKAKDGTLTQAEVDEYAQVYQFGHRVGGGGGPRDPVMAAAIAIAKSQIRISFKKAAANPQSKHYGKKFSDIEASAVLAAAKAAIDKDPSIMERAKARVAEEQAAASDDLGALIADLPEKTVPQAA